MKLATALFAIMATIAAAEASPKDDNLGCEPGTYRCDGTTGWEVCNTRAVFVVSFHYISSKSERLDSPEIRHLTNK
jgi:hypothetical protein